ncbi:HMHA1 protein, partial [Hemiprocne comata]|nr:HMHA1 protein [Hemiprocne comata]
GTLKRPSSLSRHASAASFPLPAAGPRAVSKGHKTPTCYSPMEGGEGPFIDPEDISQLLADVCRAAFQPPRLTDPKEPQRPLAHECLGETLRILRQVINKYPLLNTLETLTAAGTLISKVKGFHYESNNETDKREFEKAVETIAVSFSSTVSEFLMGEVDSSTILSIPPSDQNQTMESLYSGIPGPGGDGTLAGMESYDTGKQQLWVWGLVSTVAEAHAPSGVQAVGAGLRVVHLLISQANMPFLSIYLLALEQDMEHGMSVLQAASTLQHQTFLQPLTVRRLEHEKRRKELKEQWHRAQRKLQEAEVNLRKAKQIYMQRSEEHDKAKYMAVKAEEEQQNTTGSITTKTLDKKRRLEEEAKNKVGHRTVLLSPHLTQSPSSLCRLSLHAAPQLTSAFLAVVFRPQSPSTRSCTCRRLRCLSTSRRCVRAASCTTQGSSTPRTSGSCSAGTSPTPSTTSSPTHSLFSFFPPSRSPFTRTRKGSFGATDFPPSADGGGSEGGAGTKEQPSGAGAAERRGGRGHQVHKSWPTSVMEGDSSLGPNAGRSQEQSGGTCEFSPRLQRLSSNGPVSSSEELEKDEPATAFEQGINGITPELAAPTGPFRNVGLSKAAQTHRLRKLRAPSKCRECNSYVYFQGAECEECYLACHKKCLETLAIQCGHKKLQGKLQLFGQDFMKASQGSPDGIPFIVKKCISEIEKRALKTKGIYRVNGVKTRVEKLCQAFENGKELVELSQASPHDISNVLKLYLRQLPEPIMPFRMYNELMGLAKESLQGGEAKGKGGKGGPELIDKGADTDKMVVSLVLRLKELLRDLPWENMATLQYLLQHLRRIVEVEQDNKMTSSNLGIVFGPTLMRPRPTDATISLSSLVDYPHQARIIEALIIFYSTIFE